MFEGGICRSPRRCIRDKEEEEEDAVVEEEGNDDDAGIEISPPLMAIVSVLRLSFSISMVLLSLSNRRLLYKLIKHSKQHRAMYSFGLQVEGNAISMVFIHSVI